MRRWFRHSRAAIGVAVAGALAATTLVAVTVGSAGAGNVRGFDGTTITVASLGIKSQFPNADVGARARIERFNNDNEIKGVKIEYAEYADDKQDQATALSETRRLVTQVGVFAIVGDLSQFNAGDYLNQQHVPYFGWGFDNSYCSAKPDPSLYGFGWTGCVLNSETNVIPDAGSNFYKYVSETTGKKRPTIALFGNDTNSSKISIEDSTIAYTRAGFKVVAGENELPLPPIADYTPFAQSLLTSDDGGQPDAIYCLLAVDCIPMYDKIKSGGYEGIYLSAVFSPLVVRQMEGSVATTFFVPPDQSTAGLDQLREDVNAIEPGAGDNIDSGLAAAYSSTDMFITALKKVAKKGKSAITPEAVQKAAMHQRWEIEGLVGPLGYPASTVRAKPYCTGLVSSDGTTWSQVQPYSCTSKQFIKK
jgi:ABC-type branched-subunit amino acid transport system substrate-binding protein